MEEKKLQKNIEKYERSTKSLTARLLPLLTANLQGIVVAIFASRQSKTIASKISSGYCPFSRSILESQSEHQSLPVHYQFKFHKITNHESHTVIG